MANGLVSRSTTDTFLAKVAIPMGFMALGLLLGYIQGRKAKAAP
jgi:hypothetical protein